MTLADVLNRLKTQLGLTPAAPPATEYLSAGSYRVDRATGGGLPRGRVTEIYGPESSGKSALCLQAIARAQRAGQACAYIDAEHAFDSVFAARIGVDISRLVLLRPETGEQALEAADQLMEACALVVIDSAAALAPRAELLRDLTEPTGDTALQARLLSTALRRLTRTAARTGAALVFTNQLRERLGAHGETTPGGRALRFYATLRLAMRPAGAIKEGSETTGLQVQVEAVKNLLAPPFGQAFINLYYGEGFSPEDELIELGLERGCVRRQGAFYYAGDTPLGQGRRAARERLRADEALRDTLLSQI